MTITVKDLRPEDESAWEQFVADHPAAVVSYRLPYRDLLVDVLGCVPHYAIALDGEQIVGVLPVMSSAGTLGPVVNALPYFGSHGAPLVTSVAAEQALSTWYQSFVEHTGAASAVMIENPMAKFQVEPSFNVTDSRAAHVTALDDPRGLSAVVSGSVRTSIRKAERLGVEVQVANTAFESLRTLHAASMRPHGGAIKDERFFGAVESRFETETDYRIYVARREGAVIAALLIFFTGSTVDYFMPATDPVHRSSEPMAAILFRAMSDARENGAERWNWGGSWPSHTSLQFYKAKWGGMATEYRYCVRVSQQVLDVATPALLTREYPGFYVVPFDYLRAAS